MSTTNEKTGLGPAARTTTLVWLITLLAVFVVMVLLGITLRLAQGAAVDVQPPTFYAIMTMHGLGMAGSLFSLGLVIVWYVTAQRCRPSMAVAWIAYVLFLVGAVGLLTATLVGGFGAGWYSLYPLPFVGTVWPNWATGTTIVSLMLLGVGWLILQLDLLRAMAARYGAGRLLAWDYLGGREPSEPLPSAVLVATMCTIAGTLGTISGAATLVMYLFKWLAPTTQFDPLLLKNTMFMFGHTIVNVTMYCGICAVYELMPTYTKRPWKVNRLVALSWNATLLFVLTAYFHHLYMDFAQAEALQFVGQIASYASAIPATAVTVFGLGSQLYRSGVRWTFAPLAMATGIVGWVIGGIAAVVDSTIAVNRIFHNTLWVPGHFHTYFLVGFVLVALGFAHHLVQSRAERTAGIGLAAMLAGGYGFLLMFYLGGMSSVPRRYASYAAIPFGSIAKTGTHLALYGGVSASLFLLGLLTFYLSLVLGGRRTGKADPATSTAAE
jgi:cytochrome c oxidase subunit I